MRYFSILGGLAVSTCLMAADVSVVEEIVCKVNGDIITRSDLDREPARIAAILRAQGEPEQRIREAVAQQAPNILRDKIDNLLLIQKAKDLDIKVDGEVTKEIARTQRAVNVADPDKFQQMVREQTGKSYEDYKADLKNQFLVQSIVREEVMRKILIKTEELQAYYDAHKADFQREERVFLREILVAIKDKNDPDQAAAAEKKAKDLVSRARKGERFGELAVANSDEASAQSGGELPPYTKGMMSEQIEALVWPMARGEVTDPIKVSGGFLILRVEEHHKAGLAGFDEVENLIQDTLVRSRQEPAIRAYLTKLRTDAFLEIKPGYVDTSAAPGKDTTWTDQVLIKPQTTTKQEVIDQGTRKRILGIPIPGTNTHSGTSSSRSGK